MLHIPKHDSNGRAYCGPTAISAVVGIPISKIRKMVRRVRSDHERVHYGRVLNGGAVKDVRGRKLPVKGMHNSELLEVMRRLGFKAEKVERSGMTLRAMCDDIGHMGPFIANVTRHYVAISHGMICDSYTKVPVLIGDYAKLGCRVEHVWLFR